MVTEEQELQRMYAYLVEAAKIDTWLVSRGVMPYDSCLMEGRLGLSTLIESLRRLLKK